MAYIREDIVEALRTSNRLGLYFRLDTDPPLRLWMGANDCPIGVDGVDDAGSVYMGAGRLLDLPELDLMINGQADQITIGFDGVSPEHIAAISEGAPDVRDRAVHIGFSPLDENWQPIHGITPVWRGVADYWTPTRKPVTDPTKNAVHSISLTISVGDQGRAQHKGATFTPGWQSTRSAAGYVADRFFERVPRYVQGVLVAWPRF